MRQFLLAIGALLALGGCGPEHGFSEVPERAQHEREIIAALEQAPLGTQVKLLKPGCSPTNTCIIGDYEATVCGRRTRNGVTEIDIRRLVTVRRDRAGFENPISPMEGCALQAPKWKPVEIWATTYHPGFRVQRVAFRPDGS